MSNLLMNVVLHLTAKTHAFVSKQPCLMHVRYYRTRHSLKPNCNFWTLCVTVLDFKRLIWCMVSDRLHQQEVSQSTGSYFVVVPMVLEHMSNSTSLIRVRGILQH